MAADTTCNPFGIPDIDDPTGDDVLAHHDRARLDAGDKDPNAEAWPAEAIEGDPMKFDGAWSGRWNSFGGETWYDSGETKIVKRGDRVVHFAGIVVHRSDSPARWPLRGALGVGRKHHGGGTWVGRIVSDERIDGDWVSGRWDFRRRFK